MVCVQNRRDLTGHVIEESVFVTKQRPGADDGCVGEDGLDSILSLKLGTIEGRARFRVGVQVREVDKS